jgi:hypothetical protein
MFLHHFGIDTSDLALQLRRTAVLDQSALLHHHYLVAVLEGR